MGEFQTLDLVARDRRTLSVVHLASVAGPSAVLSLEGEALFQPEPGYLRPESIPLSVSITTTDSEEYQTVIDNGGLRILGPQGNDVGPFVTDYEVRPVLGARYELHSALLREDGEEADVFAISDVVPLAIGGVVLAACVALYGAQFALIKQTIDSYKAAGLVPKWRIRGSFGAAITCRFDVEIEGQNPQGKVVRKDTVSVGKKKK
jgi:hypothetical protein